MGAVGVEMEYAGRHANIFSSGLPLMFDDGLV